MFFPLNLGSWAIQKMIFKSLITLFEAATAVGTHLRTLGRSTLRLLYQKDNLILHQVWERQKQIHYSWKRPRCKTTTTRFSLNYQYPKSWIYFGWIHTMVFWPDLIPISPSYWNVENYIWSPWLWKSGARVGVRVRSYRVVDGATDISTIDGWGECQVLPVLPLQVIKVLVAGCAVPAQSTELHLETKDMAGDES